MSAGGVTFRQVLKNRSFFAIWLAQWVSSFGDWLALLALLSLVAFRRHGTPYQVSWVLIAYVLPVALVGPIAGVFVDRWNLKATMIASHLVRAALAALLALPGSLYPLYGIVFALSAVSCFFLPAQMAALPLVVRREELLVANSANTQSTYFNKVIGPAVAGLLVARLGENICFYLYGLSLLLAAALLATTAIRRQPGPRSEPRTVRAELAEGFHFMTNHRTILFLAVSVMTAVFAVSFFDALAAVFVRDILARSSRLFGVLVSLVGAGTIAAAWAVGRFGQRRSKPEMIALGILLMGASILLLASLSRVPPVLGCAVAFGAGIGCIVVSAQTLLQEETPHAILGRASSAINSLVTVAQVAGFLIAGYVTHWIGIRRIYECVGLAMLLTAAFAYLRGRQRLPRASTGELPPTVAN
ncbi:MAG: MFS transporter [Bryobacteraceae bacterium]|jgi:MFS family permease